MSLLRRIALIFALAVLSVGGRAAATPAGRPWHGPGEVEQALAEAAFEGIATRNPYAAFAYGAYSIAEFGREVTAERVGEANTDVENDLKVISREAAELRALAAEGRRPSRDPQACSDDPRPCELAARMRDRMENMPGGTGRFVARALASRRTLLIATRIYAEDSILGWLGGRLARLIGIRRATPVLRVSTRGVRSRFARAQWRAIREIERRFDLLAEGTVEVLLSQLISDAYDEWFREQLHQAAADLARQTTRSPRSQPFIPRVRIVEAPQVYLPAIALVAAPRALPVAVARPMIQLRRSEDPVIDRASVQSQIAHQYAPAVSSEPVRESHYQEVEHRSSNIPDIQLPSSLVDFDGRFPH